MQYRTFGRTGEKISLLGFGTMRLPTINDEVDEKEAIAMIRKAIDWGVNYVDTAYMYHGGRSETVTGKALKGGYREKVFIADKMPFWLAKEAGGFEALLKKQLKRLGTDRIDFYLIHALEKKMWAKIKETDLMAFLEHKKREGLIGKIGFSFHDDLLVFKQIVSEYPWEFCQIQFNYMDKEYQAGLAGLKYAGERGLPVIIMEPLKGGKLTISLPDAVSNIFDNAQKKWSPAEWALRYIADYPEVLTILSGMSTMDQVEDNIRILSNAAPLCPDDRHVINQVAKEYRNLIRVDCTGCRYCLPCSMDIPIPRIMDLLNQWHLYKAKTPIMRDFKISIKRGGKPSDCSSCKLCEERCPQHLPVQAIMKEAAWLFEMKL
jgi:predicted aldo/keto reductase-like oxidoreductase